MRRILLAVPIVMVSLACASGSNTTGTRARSDRSALSLDEMQRAGSQDAFTAVQALRPQWLTTRGRSSINLQETVKVYLDGNLMGGPEYLRQIPVSSISSMRHMDGLEATQRYGLDHGVGAILVFTRRSE